MIIDPWVAKDPRLPDSAFADPNDPRLSHNGQGEVVHRYHPTTLLNSVSKARELKAEGKFAAAPPSLDLRLLLLRKHGSFGPSITGEDVIRMNNFLRKRGPQKGIY